MKGLDVWIKEKIGDAINKYVKYAKENGDMEFNMMVDHFITDLSGVMSMEEYVQNLSGAESLNLRMFMFFFRAGAFYGKYFPENVETISTEEIDRRAREIREQQAAKKTREMGII